MIWLLNDFDLLSVILRAAVLALEALLVGGILFLIAVAIPARVTRGATQACLRGVRVVALSLLVSLVFAVLLASAVLVGTGGLTAREAMSAGPLFSEASAAVCVLLVLFFARRPDSLSRARTRVLLLSAASGLVTALVTLSHAAAQMQDRGWLLALTAAHHAGTASWIGAMPFLIATLRRTDDHSVARHVIRRYSAIALVAAASLIAAGVGLACFYVASVNGLYATTYGVMLLVKISLLGLMLLLGSANWYAVRTMDRAPGALLLRIRRFAEVEFGLGIMAILVAASLTSQPPARDVVQERLTWKDVEARLRWESPRFQSPPLKALAPPTTIDKAVLERQFSNSADSDENDRAWSEYNHHWAGLVVLIAGVFAMVSRFRPLRWARLWPLSFAGLALFILLRADPENWPLGPRPFWASFFSPDVLEHRLAALLILLFAISECLVQSGILRTFWIRYAFPVMCVLGGALLLTHTHSSATGRDELLTEISHSAIALFGAIAGWARWLELRLTDRHWSARRIAGYLWPAALIMVGVVLLDYREF